MNRIEILRGFLQHEPRDSFSRYALALEYVKAGQTDDARRESMPDDRTDLPTHDHQRGHD